MTGNFTRFQNHGIPGGNIENAPSVSFLCTSAKIARCEVFGHGNPFQITCKRLSITRPGLAQIEVLSLSKSVLYDPIFTAAAHSSHEPASPHRQFTHKWSVNWPVGVLPLVCLAWCGPALSQSRAAAPAEPEPVRVAPFSPITNVVESFVRQTNMPDALSAREADRQISRMGHPVVARLQSALEGTNQEIEAVRDLTSSVTAKTADRTRPSRLAPCNPPPVAGLGPGLKAGWAAQRKPPAQLPGRPQRRLLDHDLARGAVLRERTQRRHHPQRPGGQEPDGLPWSERDHTSA